MAAEPAPGAVRVFAPAKINLYLHVVGRRPDGYHLLDSLIAFADIGDWVTATPAAEASPRGASLLLDSHLPVSSGIGGGSSDAAATLRALCTLWGCGIDPA